MDGDGSGPGAITVEELSGQFTHPLLLLVSRLLHRHDVSFADIGSCDEQDVDAVGSGVNGVCSNCVAFIGLETKFDNDFIGDCCSCCTLPPLPPALPPDDVLSCSYCFESLSISLNFCITILFTSFSLIGDDVDRNVDVDGAAADVDGVADDEIVSGVGIRIPSPNVSNIFWRLMEQGESGGDEESVVNADDEDAFILDDDGRDLYVDDCDDEEVDDEDDEEAGLSVLNCS